MTGAVDFDCATINKVQEWALVKFSGLTKMLGEIWYLSR